MKVKLQFQVSDGQELHLAFYWFVEIQDVSNYAILGYCIGFQTSLYFSLPPLIFCFCFPTNSNSISIKGQLRASQSIYVLEFIYSGTL